ncbi:MAG: DNA recombination protein RmuC [Candidatus Magasanikbacteria bacterium]|nr:DNA recombination protein RmuC [Candidatus Magasanikbacteria bacterium]MBT4071446.1 DNA recombination protein RmuC [Candidatus Magasanikbacteria bacterium]
MQNILLLVVVLLILGLTTLVIILLQKIKNLQNTDNQDIFLLLQQQMQDLNKTMDQKMGETYKNMSQTQQHIHSTLQEQFSQNTRMIHSISKKSTDVIEHITQKLTSLDKTNQQVIGFSEQLQNLEKVLTHQKNRGNLGEAGLQLVLENILPPTAFKVQYQFNDGDIVDAAVFTKDGIIPIDSKFSLDNYNRILVEKDKRQKIILEKEFKNDLKKRIDETAKYIKPKEGTLEFAFMFIPAEAIYYDLLVNEVGAVKVNTRSLIDYAFQEKKVIIVSPTTFAAYLQTVLQGLHALKIEENAKEIQKNVQMLGKHITAYDEFMQKLGKSMGTTVNHYNKAYKELGKIDKDVVRITKGERVIDPISVEKPIDDLLS